MELAGLKRVMTFLERYVKVKNIFTVRYYTDKMQYKIQCKTNKLQNT